VTEVFRFVVGVVIVAMLVILWTGLREARRERRRRVQRQLDEHPYMPEDAKAFLTSGWPPMRFKDETINRDQHRKESAIRLASLQGKSAKGFSAQQDRRAHVRELQKKVN